MYLIVPMAGTLDIPSVFKVQGISLEDEKYRVKIERIISTPRDVNKDFWKDRTLLWPKENIATSEREVFVQIFK